MDFTIISTFRCNSRCQMCFVWQNPTSPLEEISLETIEKLPSGFDNVNISGGEPTLRRDLAEMVDIVYPKARITEISSNGLHPEKLVPIIKKYRDIKVRFSLEGDEMTNNSIRGEKDGYATKMRGLRMLREAGGTDLGFATVIQDENISQLVSIFEMANSAGFELSTSTLHNAWQFYKNDNFFYDRVQVAKTVEDFITSLLRTNNVKNWFRAYLNLGLMKKILGQDRLMGCTAGKDFMFVDPWSDVWACNVRSDLRVGNLAKQTWDEIISSRAATDAIEKVAACNQNCWMVTTARTAMRSKLFPQLPKLPPFFWVLQNKAKVMLGGRVNFDALIDFSDVKSSPYAPRTSFLNDKTKGKLVKGRETVEQHYPLKKFLNK